MSLNHSPSIVTSGLTLCLDAANPKSYPGSGTSWSDLSGNNNNGTIVNSPAYTAGTSGYFLFSNNTYVSFSYVQPAQTTSTSFSWNIWVYPTRNNSLDVLIGNRGGAELNFTKITTNNAEYYPASLGGQTPINIWQNICFVKNGTQLSYYRNSQLIASISSAVTKTSIPFYIGGDPVASEYATARISQVGVYSVALSQTQITQNFNALRGRYGI